MPEPRGDWTSRLGLTASADEEVGPALQQTSTVAFDWRTLLSPHGICVPAGQQLSASPTEQASAGIATPRRLNQTARMAVSRRITRSALCDPPLCRR